MDSIRLCRSTQKGTGYDVVSVRINGRKFRHFDGYELVDQSFYRLRRGAGYYEIGLGRLDPGGFPITLWHAVEFSQAGDLIEIRRVFTIGYMLCDGTKNPVDYILDLTPKMPLLTIKNSHGRGQVTYQLKQPIQTPSEQTREYFDDILFDDNFNHQVLCDQD